MDAFTTFASAAVAYMIGYLLGTRSGDAFANEFLMMARDTVEKCNEMIDRYNALVDNYRRLFDAYDEAYHILEENGLIGGDGDETLSGDDGTEEDA